MPEQSKVILITGCSSGFGYLMATQLAKKGHRVYATMRNLEKAYKLKDFCLEHKIKIPILELDVTNPDTIDPVIDQIMSEQGYIDVLINNAGIALAGFFEDLTDEEIRHVMETNLFGVQNMVRAVAPIMRPRKQGHIINISSVAGLSANPCFGAYNASKFALEGFSESLYYELKQFGIDVALVEPGPYRTEIFFSNANFAKNFHNEQGPYFKLNQLLLSKVQNRIHKSMRDPQEVIDLIKLIVETKKPKFRYVPSFSTKLEILFKRFIPFSFYSWLKNEIIFSSKE